jgi:delta 1-pyrroline-5-carboxylate dehydrogenase
LDKHAQSLKMAHDHETRTEENKKLNEAVDALILRHKAEVSSLRLEIVRMQNSNERNLASLKDEVKVLLETRIPKEKFQQIEKQNRKLRVAVEDAQKESLAAAVALSAERESRIEEMRRSDQQELRAQKNIELWQKRCRKVCLFIFTIAGFSLIKLCSLIHL